MIEEYEASRKRKTEIADLHRGIAVCAAGGKWWISEPMTDDDPPRPDASDRSVLGARPIARVRRSPLEMVGKSDMVEC